MEISITLSQGSVTFRTSVAGVTFANADGSDRQAIVKHLRVGELLALRRDAGNIHDPWAVAVFTQSNHQVGYVPAGDVRLARHLDEGGKAIACVLQVTGGGGFLGKLFKRFERTSGCVIQITKQDPDWNAIAPYMEMSRQIAEQLDEAKIAEAENRQDSIKLYSEAAGRIVAMDSIGLIAAAWRRVRHPVNRISLLLEKEKDYARALEAINQYEQFSDYYGLTSVDKQSVASRKSRLEQKLGRAKGGA